MFSFHDMGAALIWAIVLAVVVIVAAALAEGRGQHLLELVQRVRGGGEPPENILEHEVPREGYDWSVIGRVDSPTMEEDGEHRPRWKDAAAMKDRLPEVRRSLPALKDVPVLSSLTQDREKDLGETTMPGSLADTATR